MKTRRPNRIKDITGQRFGALVAIGIDFERDGRHLYWICDCDCGVRKSIRGAHLKAGRIRSCGCWQEASRIKHGSINTRAYSSWKNMMQRCTNPKKTGYQNYGGRGISVCDRWTNFANFFADMGERPLHYSLERKDNNAGYSPENCEWASRSQQNRNMRLKRSNKTGYKGVCWSQERGKYVAQIVVYGENIPLGRFSNLEDAVSARAAAEERYW